MRYLLIPALLLAALPAPALAYIGPGAGLSAVGSFVALLGAVLLAIVGFVWYPIKRLMRGRRKNAASPAPASEAGTPADGSSRSGA
ncbi:MAG: hypothetical protein KDE35_15775 [Geminicoccaceae bacterium]|nr:hypothetical protein [Geminicoccaceae bacterium]